MGAGWEGVNTSLGENNSHKKFLFNMDYSCASFPFLSWRDPCSKRSNPYLLLTSYISDTKLYMNLVNVIRWL